MLKRLFDDWTIDDWINHILFTLSVILLIYSFFFHG